MPSRSERGWKIRFHSFPTTCLPDSRVYLHASYLGKPKCASGLPRGLHYDVKAFTPVTQRI